jgi:hypothetical protein
VCVERLTNSSRPRDWERDRSLESVKTGTYTSVATSIEFQTDHIPVPSLLRPLVIFAPIAAICWGRVFLEGEDEELRGEAIQIF